MLLFIGGGLESVHGVLQAKMRGLRTVVTDKNPDAPALKLADHALIASTYDIEATLGAVLPFHQSVRAIDGVLSIGVDVPRTVAAVCAALDVPGISEAAAALSADKLAMKERFAADGVPVPWFAPVESAHALARLLTERSETLIVKPVDSRGSRGVQRLLPGLDPYLVYERAKEQSPSGRVMAEAYLDGPQISTESLILDGVAHTPGFSDRNYELLETYAPFFIENGGDLPSMLPASHQSAVRALIDSAARSIGVTNGMLKGDIVVHNGVPYVIEVATRLSGGYLCTLEIPLNTGVDFLGAVMSWALNEPVNPHALLPTRQMPICQRYAFLEPGVVTSVSGLDEALSLPGIAEIVVYVRPGDVIRTPTDTTARAAMVIAAGKTRAEAQSRADAALKTLRIEISPEIRHAQTARKRASR